MSVQTNVSTIDKLIHRESERRRRKIIISCVYVFL